MIAPPSTPRGAHALIETWVSPRIGAGMRRVNTGTSRAVLRVRSLPRGGAAQAGDVFHVR